MSLLPARRSSTPAASAPQPAAATNPTHNDAAAAIPGLRSTVADRFSAFSTGSSDADLGTGAGAPDRATPGAAGAAAGAAAVPLLPYPPPGDSRARVASSAASVPGAAA